MALVSLPSALPMGQRQVDHGQQTWSGLMYKGTHVDQKTSRSHVPHIRAFDGHLQGRCAFNVNRVTHALCFQVHTQVKRNHLFAMTNTLDHIAYPAYLSWLDLTLSETHRPVSDHRDEALFKVVHVPLQDMGQKG